MLESANDVGTMSVSATRLQRSVSVHVASPLALSVKATSDTGIPSHLPERNPVLRSLSLGYVAIQAREHADPHFRITYKDDNLCQHSLDNVRRLLRAAKAKDDNETSDVQHNNSVRLAKKALQYRRLLTRAQSVDLDDPNFDLNAFLHITWCKASPKTHT